MPLVLALRRLRQADLCEIEDSLVYKVSSRSTKRLCLFEKQKQTNKKWGY